MYLNPTQMLSFTGQQINGNILERRNANGSEANLALADFHEKSAWVLDYISLGLIFCPGSAIRWGSARLASSRLGARLVSRMASAAPGRFALGATRGIYEGLGTFFTANRLGRGLALGAENNFAKAMLLNISQTYRNPSTTFTSTSFNSLYENFIKDGRWAYSLLLGIPMCYGVFRLTKRFNTFMELGLKTLFAYSAGRHQYHRMEVSERYYQSFRDPSFTAFERLRLRNELRDMAGESIAFTLISGVAALSETPFGKMIRLNKDLGNMVCSVDDILPGVVSKIKAFDTGSPSLLARQ